MASRRTFKRRFPSRRRGSGRQGMWLRQPAFNLTLQDATFGIFSDQIYTKSEWERNQNTLTQPKRAGGARLESFNLETNIFANVDASIGTFITPAAEVLVWTQSAAFTNFVTSNVQFDDVLTEESNRVLWYQTMPYHPEAHVSLADTLTRNVYTANCRVLRRGKARLSEQSIGLAVRLNFDVSTGVANSGNPLCKLDCWVTSP